MATTEEIRSQLAELVNDVAGVPVDEVQLDKSFVEDLDVDSLAMVEISDNTAANLVLTRIGGPAAFTAFCRSIGDEKTRLDRTEPSLNTTFAGDDNFTINVGIGYRLLLNDWLALRFDARDYIFDRTLFAQEETTHNLELRTGFSVFF